MTYLHKSDGRPRGFACVGLFGPKSEVNIGGALRACNCYSAAFVAVQATRAVRIRSGMDTPKTYRKRPVISVEDLFTVMPYDCVPVAIELHERARSIVDYAHPERAMYIFGPEDGTLGAKILDRCRDVLMVPTDGCMNLAATVNVVLYDRMMKQSKTVPVGNTAEDKES